MKEIEREYENLLQIDNIEEMPVEGALGLLGELIDLSSELQKAEGLRLAMERLERITLKESDKDANALYHYFFANALQGSLLLDNKETKDFDWENEKLEQQIIHLRKALLYIDDSTHPHIVKVQILTNLGSCLSYTGRVVEAISYWNDALEIEPLFGMALGNKGIGLCSYARSLYDHNQARVLIQEAYQLLNASVKKEDVHKDAKDRFQEEINWIDSIYSKVELEDRIITDEFELGQEEAKKYYEWCLLYGLFLNPLNDVTDISIAAHDIFNLPPITTDKFEGPYKLGFFNQIKQEYVSARYMYYEGVCSFEPHFSDQTNFLYDTLDYPTYSFATEQVKMTFRIMYSLFDKIAYFINDYWELGVKPNQVKFKTLWYQKGEKNKGLKSEFQGSSNWLLHGLFWLSKDLHEKDSNFEEPLDPEAKELAFMRNHIEHKYFKIHDSLLNTMVKENEHFHDKLAYSVSYDVFKERTHTLLLLVRASIIYLSLAVHHEEREKQERMKMESRITMPIHLKKYKDE